MAVAEPPSTTTVAANVGSGLHYFVIASREEMYQAAHGLATFFKIVE
jgi:hypothetical protein